MSAGHEVVIGNPRKFRYIAEGSTNTDRNDAYRLADLAKCDRA